MYKLKEYGLFFSSYFIKQISRKSKFTVKTNRVLTKRQIHQTIIYNKLKNNSKLNQVVIFHLKTSPNMSTLLLKSL